MYGTSKGYQRTMAKKDFLLLRSSSMSDVIQPPEKIGDGLDQWYITRRIVKSSMRNTKTVVLISREDHRR